MGLNDGKRFGDLAAQLSPLIDKDDFNRAGAEIDPDYVFH
ncbi:hypothetical protein CHCC14810_3676 [Bacillus licheniformis]|nr:hypothetical protein CHCC14810_3676 [Bacillus licheniformis]